MPRGLVGLRYEMLSGGFEAEEANFMKFHTILIDVVRSKMGHFRDQIFIQKLANRSRRVEKMACSTVSCLALLNNMTLNTKSFENPVFYESKWPSGALLNPFLFAEVPQTSFFTIQNEGAIFFGGGCGEVRRSATRGCGRP